MEEQFRILHIFEVNTGFITSIKAWLDEALNIPSFYQLLNLTNNILEFKMGCDLFKLTRRETCINWYFTFFNLGELINSPQFVWTVAIFTGKEDQQNIRANLTNLIKELEDLLDNGYTFTSKYFLFNYN